MTPTVSTATATESDASHSSPLVPAINHVAMQGCRRGCESAPVKLISWNMAGAWGYRASAHARAWEWLCEQDVDAALVQEAVVRENVSEKWDSVVWSPKYGHNWGSAVLSRGKSYMPWEPSGAHPWLTLVAGAACVAQPADPAGLWLVSIHSSAGAWKDAEFPTLPPLEGVSRCSTDGSELWEIEVIAHELRDVLRDRPFVLGGDLNSALAFDRNYGGRENEILFANLARSGFVDLRPRHQPEEVRTYFKQGTRAYQLDHTYADPATETRVTSWTVLSDVPSQLGLSDHAPVLVTLEGP